MGRKRPGTESHRKADIKDPFPSHGGPQTIGGFWVRNLERNSRNYINFAAQYSAKKFIEEALKEREHKIEKLAAEDFEVRACGAEVGDVAILVNDKVVFSWTGDGTLKELLEYKYTSKEAEWILPEPYPNTIRRMMGEIQSRQTFEKPESKRERISRDGLITIGEICDELKINPRDARQFLRSKMTKPEAGWAWTPAEAEDIKKLLKKL